MVGVNLFLFSVKIYFLLRFQDDFASGGQVFEEPVLQFIECKQPDPNNQLIASPQEQLMGSAKFNSKRKLLINYFTKMKIYHHLLNFSTRTNLQRILFVYISK